MQADKSAQEMVHQKKCAILSHSLTLSPVS